MTCTLCQTQHAGACHGPWPLQRSGSDRPTEALLVVSQSHSPQREITWDEWRESRGARGVGPSSGPVNHTLATPTLSAHLALAECGVDTSADGDDASIA